MPRDELPHATVSMLGSMNFISLLVSAAARPYSFAVLCPICQGPSISLPMHQSLMSWGSS